MHNDKYYVVNCDLIKEGSTGVTYQDKFCDHFVGAKTIEIREPYLRNNHQFGNVKKLVELLKVQEDSIRIVLITSQSTGRFSEDYTTDMQIKSLNSLSKNLHKEGVSFKVVFDNKSHVRRIDSDTGKIIKSDRGLHIYKERPYYNGEDDFSKRECKKTEIDYIEPLDFKIANSVLGNDKDESYIIEQVENVKKKVLIENITENDVNKKIIRIVKGNKHLFPSDIKGQRNSYILPLLAQDEKHDFKYTTIFTGKNSKSGIIRLGADLYDHIGITIGTKLSIELRDDGVYLINKIEEGVDNHR